MFSLAISKTRCVFTLRLWRFFFFSSRRRHTRSTRDWSSDVCSSDLRREPSSVLLAFQRLSVFANATLQIVEQIAIAIRDGIDERRQDGQRLARISLKKAIDQLGRDCMFNLVARRRGLIDERAADFATRQKSLLVEPVHRRHYGRVRDTCAHQIACFANADLALLPCERHHFTLERAEAVLQQLVRRLEAPQQQAPHVAERRRSAAHCQTVLTLHRASDGLHRVRRQYGQSESESRPGRTARRPEARGAESTESRT